MRMTEPGVPETSPSVTIGISTYNRVDGTFPLALRSALDQSYPNLEVLVCDNASEDGTEAYMARQRDARLRYHRHPTNIGAHANFNACVDLAHGEYFLLLHDDDLLEPGFVAQAMAAIGDERPGVVLAGTRRIDGTGNRRGVAQAPPAGLGGAGLFEAWFQRRCSFYFCSTLFHTERLRAIGGFHTPEGLFQDVVAIAELASRAGYASVPVVGGAFRRHEANRGSASHALRWARDAEDLLERLRTLFPDHAERLHALGGPYLAAKCYRYVAAERSLRERLRLYRDIDHRFGHTLSPWRFLATQTRRCLRRRLGVIRRGISRRRGSTAAA